MDDCSKWCDRIGHSSFQNYHGTGESPIDDEIWFILVYLMLIHLLLSVCLLVLDFQLLVSRCHGNHAGEISAEHLRSHLWSSLGHAKSTMGLLDPNPIAEFQVCSSSSSAKCCLGNKCCLDSAPEHVVCASQRGNERGRWKEIIARRLNSEANGEQFF